MLGEPWPGDAGGTLKALWHRCPQPLGPRGQPEVWWQVEVCPRDNQPLAQRHLLPGVSVGVRGEAAVTLQSREQKCQ